MDPNNPVIQLCIQGTQAEFQGRQADASALYEQAWEIASDDYEKCIAAHYVARFQETPQEALRWNQEALQRANAVHHDRIADFYPSLYLNMGASYEQLGRPADAQHYYDLAAKFGVAHKAG